MDSGGHGMTTSKRWFAPAYEKNPTQLRVLSPYMGEAFESAAEAKVWVAEDDLDRFMEIRIYELTLVETMPIRSEAT